MTGKVILTKYVQSAFLVQYESESFAFDFGSESTDDQVASIAPVTATFVSHVHPDHFHPNHLTRLAASVYAPRDVVALITDESLSVVTVSAGERVEIGELRVDAFAADHGPNISAPIENLGFLLRLAGRTIVYLGDVALPPSLPPERFDAVLVPVGSSKVFSPEEAARFIRAINHDGVVIPIHYHGRADRKAGEQFRDLIGSFCDVRLCGVDESVEL